MSRLVRVLLVTYLPVSWGCAGGGDVLKEKQEEEQKAGGELGNPSALPGNLVGGVQLAAGVMGPCGPT